MVEGLKLFAQKDGHVLEIASGPVFVTGAAGGIGSQLVDELLSAGHQVCAMDVNPDLLDKRCADWGRNVYPIAFDATDPDATKDAVRAGVDRLGVPFGIVNIAGDNRIKPLTEISDAEWRYLIDVNLTSTFYMCREVLPLMAAERVGRVINTSSIFGLRGQANDAAYCAAKAGVIGLTRALAVEYAGRNIAVNSIAPVATLTERVAKLDPSHLDGQLQRIPMGRFSEVSDVTAAFHFLLSPGAAFFTGQVLSPNGGDWMP
ncbi:SDR family NAD(P)-dependent oxidoreductase [Rhodococcus opacus]|uniref:SDR family NAD(P)-dependent oxidoreductase n=1 Tax=Rhodococcus opacus TaxID=37919 RepID=UPI002474E445|nr:SDR family NAD(P)-dependent oxidoreductase [Rhodococcus opacus]MDH6292490.1 NAD(P)-dependent dehydrogenase (short-subunit alcohol dehydrogenase family) [Rhodococcus opacus]